MAVYAVKIGTTKSRAGGAIERPRTRRLGGIGQVPVKNLLINPGFEAGRTGWRHWFGGVGKVEQFEVFDIEDYPEYPHLVRSGIRSIKYHPPMTPTLTAQCPPPNTVNHQEPWINQQSNLWYIKQLSCHSKHKGYTQPR